MEQLLGIVPPDDRLGCLQDIHWYGGAFGYFPGYTLGAMTAAQLFDAGAARQSRPRSGDRGRAISRRCCNWLRTNVHGLGSRYSSDEIVQRATGRSLDTNVFKATPEKTLPDRSIRLQGTQYLVVIGSRLPPRSGRHYLTGFQRRTPPLPYQQHRGRAPPLKFDDVLLDRSRVGRRALCAVSLAADFRPRIARVRRQILYRAGHLCDAPVSRRHDRATMNSPRWCATPMQGFDHPDDRAAGASSVPASSLLELFHGPTLAFKDYALQLVGRLFDHVLTKRGRAHHHRRRHLGRYRLGGDRGLPGPRRASTSSSCIRTAASREVQRRQMTTVPRRNVHNIADRRHLRRLPGPGEGPVRRSAHSATSSAWRRSTRSTGRASWPRSPIISPRRSRAGRARARPGRFAVPTGNFGNVYRRLCRSRAWACRSAQLIIGSNSNDILTPLLRVRRDARRPR